MIDKNNNNNGDAFVNSTSETPSEALTVWLKDHTDPHINPWSAEKWKQARELLKDDYWDHQENCAQQRHPNCIDPTANRLLQLFGLNGYCIFKLGQELRSGNVPLLQSEFLKLTSR